MSDIEKYFDEIERENKDFDRYFKKWTKLRGEFDQAKREKNFQRIIDVSNLIKKLDAEEKESDIFVPLFDKAIADAYLKLEEKDKAIKHYQAALSGFIAEHKKNKANDPDSWTKEISRLEKTLAKLQS